MANESEVVLSLELEDNVSPALASLEAGYAATLASLEAATLATAATLEAAWQAPVRSLAQASQEATAWLVALGQQLAALGSVHVSPTVTINDLATPTLRAIQAELAALSGLVTVTTQAPLYSTAQAGLGLSRQLVRTVIVPELDRLGYRA